MMKPLHALAGTVLALLLGAVAGYLVGSGAGEASAPPPGNPGPVAAAPQPQAPNALPPEQPTQPATGGLAAWLATVADEKPRPGTGRIHGQVATADGRGVAGITVSAAAQYPHKWRNTPDVPLEEIVEDTARRTHFQRAGISRTQTDGDGRYEFTNLGDYEYVMSAAGPGYNCDAKSVYRPVHPGTEVNFTAKPVGEVELDVLMPDGSPATGADIWLKAKRGGRGYTWKPDERVFPLEPGKTNVHATMGAHREMITDPQEIEYNEGDPLLKLTLQLKVVPGILCKVTLPPELSNRWGISVGIIHEPPAQQPAIGTRESFEASEDLWEKTEVAFTKLKTGKYRVAIHADGRILALTDIQLGQEFLTVLLAVPAADVKDYIVVRVRAPDGSPVADASLGVSFSIHDFGSKYDKVILSRPDGSYWVARFKPQSREAREGKPWKYFITASAHEFGVVEAEYQPSDTHELELKFQSPASLTVNVPGAMTHPLRKRIRPMLWRITKSSRSLVSRAFPDEALDSDVLKADGLTPGRYRFSLHLKPSRGMNEFNDGDGDLAAWEFDLDADDDATLTCEIPVLCRLTLLVPDPASVPKLHLRRTVAHLPPRTCARAWCLKRWPPANGPPRRTTAK